MKQFLLIPLITLGLSLPACAAVAPGEAALDFTLTDSKGTSHKLSDFRGKR